MLGNDMVEAEEIDAAYHSIMELADKATESDDTVEFIPNS